jgi:formylglycine-generating enzyme required for sulfatase activity
VASALLAGSGLLTTAAHADTFGTTGNEFTIDFTTIGNPGNAADTTGYGSVNYTYRIGTYAISQNQIDKATASGLENVTAGAWSGDLPAANMTWYESAAFVNWLNTSKGFQPAYNLSWSGSTWSMALWTATDNGYDANNKYRNSLAKYFLPSENEFYKAAWGKSNGSGYNLYSTDGESKTVLIAAPTPVASGTDAGTAIYGLGLICPSSVYEAGGLSSYGTMGQGGNVWGWQESAYDGVNDDASKDRGIRGGYWGSPADDLQCSNNIKQIALGQTDNMPIAYSTSIGFRVASVDVFPEPSTYALCVLAGVIVLVAYRCRLSL